LQNNSNVTPISLQYCNTVHSVRLNFRNAILFPLKFLGTVRSGNKEQSTFLLLRWPLVFVTWTVKQAKL